MNLGGMMSKQLVNIIIPLYNQSEYIVDCIDSILAQSFKDWTATIINDCSTDRSGEIADKLAKVDKRISVIHHAKNMGLSATRNTGIAAARTEFVLPLDADDMISIHCVEKMLDAIRENKGDIIYSNIMQFGHSPGPIVMPDYDYDKEKIANQMVCCSMFRKKDWERVGGYDEEMKSGFEDWMYFLKLGHIGLKGYRIPELLFFYRTKKESMLTHAMAKKDKIIKQMHELYPEIWSIK